MSINIQSIASKAGRVFVGVAMTMVAAGCGDAGNTDGGSSSAEENVGQVDLSLAAVPAGVQCISATFGSVTRAVTVAANQTSVNLLQLPLGSITVNAQAFNVACSALTGATATWVADAQTAFIAPGVSKPLTLVFRQYLPTQANANFLPTIKKLVAGYGQTAALLANGDVAMWGEGAPPGTRMGLSNVTDVALGMRFACALKGDGSVWCWGADGSTGQLGAGPSVVSSATPVKVLSAIAFSTLTVGSQHACATTAYSAETYRQGTYAMYCWGANYAGQVGDGTMVNRFVPTQVSTIGFSVTAGAYHTCAITPEGTVRCWGSNASYELGNGSMSNVITSGAAGWVSGVRNVVQLAGGQNTTCALDARQQAWCWGRNAEGNTGIGTISSYVTTPTQVYGGSSVASIASNCMVKTDGSLWCWGDSYYGQVGNKGNGSVPRPVSIFSSGIASVSHGNTAISTCALTTAGIPYCWGNNYFGQTTGRDSDLSQSSPFQITNW